MFRSLVILSALLAPPALAESGEEAWLAANLDTAARYAGEIEICQPGFASDMPAADDALTGALRCTFRAIETLHGPEAAAEELARATEEGRTQLAFLLGMAVPAAGDDRLGQADEACLLFETALSSPMMTALADRVGSDCGIW